MVSLRQASSSLFRSSYVFLSLRRSSCVDSWRYLFLGLLFGELVLEHQDCVAEDEGLEVGLSGLGGLRRNVIHFIDDVSKGIISDDIYFVYL
jgi:hypothetical protein